MKNSNSKTKMSWGKMIPWFEPAGLLCLLIAFGWQCLQEHVAQMKTEGYIYEMNEKLNTIWDAEYDEALHSERYYGDSMVSVNYDTATKTVKPWGEIQKELGSITKLLSTLSWIRIVLFVIGSILVIISKLPCMKVNT